MEPKINKVQMEKVLTSLSFLNEIDVSTDSSRGGINLAQKEGVSVSRKSFSFGHIDVELEDTNNSVRWSFSGYYGLLMRKVRRRLGMCLEAQILMFLYLNWFAKTLTRLCMPTRKVVRNLKMRNV